MSVYTKWIQKRNYLTVENHLAVVLFKFSTYKMLFCKCRCDFPFMKCDEGQWSNDVTVNTHCNITMGRWHCLGNHISQQWVGDDVAAQGGASVQLYCQALNQFLSALYSSTF